MTVDEINEFCKGIYPANKAIWERNKLMIKYGHGTTFAELKYNP